jgi:hypothetical protein
MSSAEQARETVTPYLDTAPSGPRSCSLGRPRSGGSSSPAAPRHMRAKDARHVLRAPRCHGPGSGGGYRCPNRENESNWPGPRGLRSSPSTKPGLLGGGLRASAEPDETIHLHWSDA